eukprot:COSAG04_NODE_146_length_22922_cov_53.506901_23_plen_52_part_00
MMAAGELHVGSEPLRLPLWPKLAKKKKLPLGGPNRNPRTLGIGRYLKVGGL